ncbi:MAG: hypothetical protein DRI70_02710, partial [Bacteroidetes bacterium]
MSANHVFFSYSRDDSEFVLDLAKKLRAAGRNVWLDQVDIETGERWDRSIEEALEKADVLLVVLSKTSVDSNNVMDEVSFALEEGKRILPVLYEDCDIPFRLRRLQFADFTTDVDSGMETLFKALDMDNHSTDKVETPSTTAKVATPVKAESKKEESVAKNAEINKPVGAKKSGSKLILIIIIAVLSIALGGWGLYSVLTVADDKAFAAEDQEDWDAIVQDPDIVSLNEHIDLFAPCEHETMANKKIDSLSLATIEISTGGKDIPIKTETDPETDPEPVIVTGYNLTLVKYTNGEVDPAGQFKLVDTKVWEEESFINGSIYK